MSTTLTNATEANDSVLVPASLATLPVAEYGVPTTFYKITIDSEDMLVVDQTATQITVVRGINSTAPATHAAGATVTYAGIATTQGTVAPASGAWNRGDRCWNTAPSAAGVPGWVCTAAGSPGTWKAMAALAA